MLESERKLWLRAVVLLAPAPMVIALLAYAAASWIYPKVAERSRVEGSLSVGFGATAFFTGVLLLGIARGRLRDFTRADWIWYLGHALALITIGIGLVSFVWSPVGGAIGAFGIALEVVGFAYLVTLDLVCWIGRLVRPRDRGQV